MTRVSTDSSTGSSTRARLRRRWSLALPVIAKAVVIAALMPVGPAQGLDDETALLLQQGRKLVSAGQSVEALPFLEQSLDMLAVDPSTRPRSIGMLSFELAQVYDKASRPRQAARQLRHAWAHLATDDALALLGGDRRLGALARSDCAARPATSPEVEALCRRLGSAAASPAARRPPPTAARPVADPASSAPVPRASPPPRTRAAPSIVYRAQLGARRDLAEASAELQKMQRNLGEILARQPAHIESVRLEGQGLWHRLQFGDFASKREAKALCDAVKRRGLDCWVAGPIDRAGGAQ